MTKPIIGFIGLGIMGRPMAGHLLNAGYSLVVLDKNPVPVSELVALGAKSAVSPKEVALQSEIIITMLPDSPDVEAVALDENGIIAGAKAGSVHIDMSTRARSRTQSACGRTSALRTAAGTTAVSRCSRRA